MFCQELKGSENTFVIYKLKSSGPPGTLWIPGADRVIPQKNWITGCILHNLGEGPVRDAGNGSGLERGSFLSVQVFFNSLGLNFDSSEMIYITIIHQLIKEMMTN